MTAAFTFIAISIQPAVTHATLSAQEGGIAVGAMAPGAAVQTLDGKEVDLKKYIVPGKPAMLEFWATWCGNCKELEPKIIAATKKYGAQMNFITVAVSVNQSPARVAAWHKLNPIATEMVYDLHGKAGDAYDVPATSFVVLVDKAGKVTYTGLGGDQNLDAAITKALR
ncbi:MAG: TlpA disulfide reductase family protein [Gemmatimonadaceae bacterium]